MKALTFQGTHEVRLDDVPEPKLVEPTDALVRVTQTAICGSDLHVYEGREVGLDAGTVMGHEFLGEVIEVGDDVGLRPGTKVVSPFTTSCGRCFYCQRGLTSRCTAGELFGWVEHGHGLHGAQCEYVRVPLADSTLVEAPAGLGDEEALLAGDVLSTGYFCADAAGVHDETVAAVLGCGPVGLLAVCAAKRLGAVEVIAVDSVAERLALAERFGATPVDLTAEDAIERAQRATEGRGVDAVLEAVGSPEATRLAVDMVRPGGTISAVGVHTEGAFAFAPGEAYDKNLTYRAGRCPARFYMERVLDWLREDRVPVAEIFSHRVPIGEGVDAYKLFAERRAGCTKVLLEP